MRFFYVLSVWLHILAAATWLGGMLFLALAVVPLLRRPEYQGIAAPLVHWLGVRFRWVGWICLGLLVLSGTFNLIYRGYGWDDVWSGRLWQGPFGQALGIKLFLVAVILVLSAVHDFRIGPRATALWQANPASAEARRLRRQASWIGRLNLILALIVVALAVILVRGWP
jgi:putative copper resistance protein D